MLRLATGRDGRASAQIARLLPGAATVTHVVVGRAAPDGFDPRLVAEIDGSVSASGVRAGFEAGVPVVLEVRAWGNDAHGGLAGMAAWGALARALVDASGSVPLIAVVDGPCVGGAALVLGLVDVVIVTERARAHLTSPKAAERLPGVEVDRARFGRPGALGGEVGAAHLVAADREDALAVAADLLDLLPPNAHELSPRRPGTDPATRQCPIAAAAVPRDGHLPYDVRAVLRDVVDDGDLLELHAHFAPSVVVGLARLDGWPVGLVANQPDVLAGALDIASSQKAARFVRFCDAFNLPIITFVDTPGFRPGRDQEWRGMIRHGAQLAFAYAEATVPRCCVILRKAYGGAYIVMDAKSMGNDHCVAWPSAEVAVMGAAGAVEILHRRALDALDPESRDAAHDRLLADYEATYLTPRLALARGAIDEVIQPGATRAVLAGALAALPAKRERVPHRRHANTPL
jgi:acetyl-CoA carboxylase carboxyltransferase component